MGLTNAHDRIGFRHLQSPNQFVSKQFSYLSIFKLQGIILYFETKKYAAIAAKLRNLAKSDTATPFLTKS